MAVLAPAGERSERFSQEFTPHSIPMKAPQVDDRQASNPCPTVATDPWPTHLSCACCYTMLPGREYFEEGSQLQAFRAR